MKHVLLVLGIVGLGLVIFTKINGPSPRLKAFADAPALASFSREPTEVVQVTEVKEASHPRASPFSCDGRTTCSQMRSCAEAQYFLAHCPNVRMDGNHDGEPCEQQWCQ